MGAFDLLRKLTSMRLLETELENDELAQYLVDLFKAKDTDMTGMLLADEIRDLLHQAMLGLSRMQIYTVISEAEVNAEDKIAYNAFIPRAVALIRSMLSFEKCIVKESAETSPEAEDQFFALLDDAFQGEEEVPISDFMSRLEACNVADAKELQAARHLLATYEGMVPVEEAKSNVWSLLKNMRRHKSSK